MPKLRYVLALFMLLLLPFSLFAGTKDYVLDPEVMSTFPSGKKKDGQKEQGGTDNYFTFHWSAKSKLDNSTKKWADGYEGTLRINLQGGISFGETPMNAISFTTSRKDALVRVWLVEGGEDNRQITVLNEKGETEYISNLNLAKNDIGYVEFTLPNAGLHYLGSTPGNNYIFRLTVNDNEGFVATPLVAPAAPVVEEEKPIIVTYTENHEGRDWEFRTYGTSTSLNTNGITGSLKEGKVTVYSEGGKGKIVPASTDGIAYFYTSINPQTENFTLSGRITVDNWTYSNGQEGFGILVTDTVGVNGSTDTVWTNSVMAMASKVEYRNEENEKISMKLGIGALSRLGVTGEDALSFRNEGTFLYENGSSAALPEKFVSETTTLETSCADYGAGTYNIIGAYSTEPTGSKKNKLVTELLFSVRRNNNGYLVTYATPDGTVVGEKMVYDEKRDALTQIDKDHIYVGFFAARNARITVTDISLTTIAPEKDEKAKARAIAYVDPDYRIESGDNANSDTYTLIFYGNADGTLSISNDSGKLVDGVSIKAYEKARVATKLQKGSNEFTVQFVPSPDYVFDAYTKLSNYGAAIITKTVEYKTLEGSVLYVSPKGRINGKGTEASPLDIATALKFASAGQTILLQEGTYKLSTALRVERGIDGTEEAPIVLKADPKATTRPVLDFQKKASGLTLGGDWWQVSGFDVTGSEDGQKGLQLSGSHCTLEDLQTYRNGNTGLQISRLYSSDLFEDWPSDNTIRSCVSFLNADKGYEDADGFAAKLTVGNNNVFENCIAAYNADDGWDLYAKVETGSIGSVRIKDCVAFRNGFVLGAGGEEIPAGNGNGFKMGGESLSGKHVLENSAAFANKGKGIDSNSCPDIIVKGDTSFDNGSYNVAFYTNNAVNTDFEASGILSVRTSGKQAEQLKLKGTQEEAKVLNKSNYFVQSDGSSKNAKKAKVAAYWFKDTNTEAVLQGFQSYMATLSFENSILKLEEGKVTMGDYLALSSYVPAGVGARF